MLSLLLSEREVQADFMEKEGEITEDMDLIWQDAKLAIKDKLDAYGYVFTDLDADETKLKNLKDKIQLALKRIENTRKKLKVRLNFLSNGEALRGNVFSFLPYTSTRKIVTVPEALLDSESYLTIEIRKDYWLAYEAALRYWHEKECPQAEMPPYTVKKTEAKVSELPDDHAAVSIVGEPSVRIT